MALDDAKAKGVKEIEHIVLVGGMTRLAGRAGEGQRADRQRAAPGRQPR